MTLIGIFGNVTNPYGPSGFNVANYNASTSGQGLIIILSNLIKLAIIIAGLYTLINFILAGYTYLSANGDQKAIQKAIERIWRSVLGLTIVAGSILLSVVVGRLLFGPQYQTILISPIIFSP